MATIDLLSAVLPTEGWYCILGLTQTGSPRQIFVQTIQEAEAEIDRLFAQKCDMYFACAKYNNDKDGRTQKNSAYFKSFWLDIDCGIAKAYATQAEGLAALKQFCKDVSMPLPTVVNSGRGIHAYWLLNKTISRSEWKPVADRLKELCEEFDFEVDPSRTAESASVLRVPETFNFKGDPPFPTEILAMSKELDYDEIRNKLGVLIAPDYIPRELSPLTKSLMSNRQSRFKSIMLKTAEGKGCKQLENIMLNQDSIEEPLWRAGLSIAAHCVDGDEAIHKISREHPAYNADETERKARQTKGPYTCETFAKINPEGCNECPNKGKISTPILLGTEIALSPKNVEVVQETVKGTKEVYKIPEYPFPYHRGKNGGVYIQIKNEDGELDLINIYEHDLYVVKRLKDPNKGSSIWIRLHLPQDGVREFAIPLTEAQTYEKLSSHLGWHGLAGNKKQMESIAQYVITFIKDLQHREKEEIMRSQFGWADKNTKFILGDQEISAEGVTYSPPSSSTGSLAEWLKPTGDYEEWKKIAHTYNMPGFEPHAFGFFTAFGAPLLTHLNLRGAIINLINNTSGTGKSTVLKMCNSVWGHPEELMLQWKDTQNSMIHRFGILNNLPATVDEITKLSGDSFSDLAYAMSQGRGKNRMKQYENAERKNDTKWATMALCSSNASFYDKLSSLKSTPDGEFMRLLEYRIEMTNNLNKEEADLIFNGLYSHYGHAGVVYTKYLVGNLEAALDLIMHVQQRIDKEVQFTSRERFWSAVVACNIAGALIAKDLGIINIDIKRVYDWIVSELKVMRYDIKAPTQAHSSIIGEFMNEHRGCTLVINGLADGRSGMEQLPIVEPKFNDLFIRIEPDTKKLYINAKQLRDYCTKQQVTLKETLKSLTADSVYLGKEKKRLSKGTKVQSPPVDVYVFDLGSSCFMDTDLYVEAAKTTPDADPRTGL